MVILRCDLMDPLLDHMAERWNLELVTEATPDAWLYYAHR